MRTFLGEDFFFFFFFFFFQLKNLVPPYENPRPPPPPSAPLLKKSQLRHSAYPSLFLSNSLGARALMYAHVQMRRRTTTSRLWKLNRADCRRGKWYKEHKIRTAGKKGRSILPWKLACYITNNSIWKTPNKRNTVEPCYTEDLGTMKATLLYIRVKKNEEI